MAWQSGAGGSGTGGMASGDSTGVQAYTLQGKALELWPVLVKELSLISRLQVLCDSCKPNGTDMNATEMRGRLNARR